ncbi:HAD family hydrolase [Patescibacteria group bacterium]|nr:HAD family hydrolase [Patescibacteria group bacterium]
MLKKKLIIFDFDGVIYDATEYQIQRIIDSADLALKTFKTTAKIPCRNYLKGLWGKSMTQMAKLFIDQLNWTSEEAKLFLYFEKQNSGFFENALAVGYHNLVEKLKSTDVKIAICSNRYTNTFYNLLKNLQVSRDDFEFIILGDTLKDGIKKPDKRILDPILLKYNKEDVVLIGDTISSDFMTAVNAEIDFIGISSILHSQDDFNNKFKEHINGNSFLAINEFKQLNEILLSTSK